MTPLLIRRLAVSAGVALAIATPALTMGFHLGLDQAQFAAQGDGTLRAAPYAFAIWGLIYLGLVAYAVAQWRRDSATLAALAWPSMLATVFCAAWIVTTALNLQWLSVGIICAAAIAAAVPLTSPASRRAEGPDRWLAVWPNALLSGWLLLAAGLAIVTVSTAQGLVAPAARPSWALAALLAVLAAALGLAARCRRAVVLAPVVWGLVAVAIAERDPQPNIAWAAAATAAALATAGMVLATWRRKGRGPEILRSSHESARRFG